MTVENEIRGLLPIYSGSHWGDVEEPRNCFQRKIPTEAVGKTNCLGISDAFKHSESSAKTASPWWVIYSFFTIKSYKSYKTYFWLDYNDLQIQRSIGDAEVSPPA